MDVLFSVAPLNHNNLHLELLVEKGKPISHLWLFSSEFLLMQIWSHDIFASMASMAFCWSYVKGQTSEMTEKVPQDLSLAYLPSSHSLTPSPRSPHFLCSWATGHCQSLQGLLWVFVHVLSFTPFSLSPFPPDLSSNSTPPFYHNYQNW